MTGPMVLLYNLSGNKASRIKLICIREHIWARSVKPEELGCPISRLLAPSATAPVPYEGEGFGDEMLVLYNFSSEQLDAFLKGLRTEKVAVALKAVVTQHNQDWDSVKLRNELLSEHTAMHAQQSAKH